MSSPSDSGLNTVEIYDGAKHYGMVKEWWESRGADPVPENQIPSPGVVVSCDGVPVAALWALLSNSNGVGFLLFPVTAPDVGVRGVRGMSVAREFLEEHARDIGYYTMWFATEKASLGREFKRNGYLVAQNEVSIYAKPICHF